MMIDLTQGSAVLYDDTASGGTSIPTQAVLHDGMRRDNGGTVQGDHFSCG